MKSTRFAIKTRTLALVIATLTCGYLFYYVFSITGLHLTALRFNPFALVSALTLVINLALLIYFLQKPSRTEERVWLAMYIVNIIVYAASELMQRLSADPNAALFWGEVSSVAVFVGPSIYLFTLAYTNQTERRHVGTIAFVLLSGLFFLFFESGTNIVFNNNVKFAVDSPWGFDLRSAIGPASGVLVIWYYGLLIAAISRLISFRRHTRNVILRKQSLLFIFAIAIPLIGGTITDVLLPTFNINSVPPLAAALGTPAAALFIYGLLRYQLLTVSPTLFSNTILSIMQESVIVTDHEFNVIFVNDRAEVAMGIKNDSQKRVSLETVITQSSLETFQSAFKEASATGHEVDIPHIDVKIKPEGQLPVRVTASPFKLGGSDTWVMALTDITKELQVRSVIEHEVQVRTEELHRARSYLVSSIGSLEQGFILVNLKDDIELANGVAAKLLKSTSDKLAGVPLGSVVKELPWDVELAPAVAKVLDTKRSRRLDVAATDGSFYTTFITPVVAGEHVLGATIIIEDITEQKILDRSKDEFFSIASHELRTPLTAIRGNMSMVKDYFPDAMKDEGLSTMINDTHGASVRLIEIVNDFLDSSKLEQGKMEFNLQPVDIKPVLEGIQKDVQTLLEKRSDKISIEDMAKIPPVMADEGRLRQIVYNLVSNAIKYSENASIAISAKVADSELQLRVTDSGKGISPEGQKLLFHKFQQTGDPLTRDDTKGTGLGLYISRLLATNMHGNVVLESSEVGKGSTFMLTLPLATKKAIDAAKAATRPATTKS